MERIKEDRFIIIKDDKGNFNRCIVDVVSVCFMVFREFCREVGRSMLSVMVIYLY